MKMIDRLFTALRQDRLLFPIGLVLVLVIIVTIRNPVFLSGVGLAGAILVASPTILAAMALTPVAMAGRGGVDLSIGPLIGFINVTITTWLTPAGFEHPAVVFLYAIVAGCLWQLALALIVIYVRVSPIIVALAGFLILQGVNLIILPRPGSLAPTWLADWGYGTNVFSPVLFVLLGAGILWFIIQRSSPYQQLCLTGADERMAYTCGVSIGPARIFAHLIAGVFAGLAGVCLTGVIGSGDPTQGNTLTLQAVTALVLGGTSLAGGRGSVMGSALGAIAMYLIFAALSSFNFGSISGFMTQLSFGVILVATLVLSSSVLRMPTSTRRAI